jgi:hypothetical protein
MPLSLSDDEYAAIQAAAAPIHPLQRGDFLQALAKELERHPVVSPGLGATYRIARDFSVASSASQRVAPEREGRGSGGQDGA